MSRLFDFDSQYFNLGAVAGIDEAGRGPLAGPVVAASVIMPQDENLLIEEVNDSKKLSEKKREKLFDLIVERAVAYAIEEVDCKVIDEINILNATKLAMSNCLENITEKPDFVLIDAVKLETGFQTMPIIKGDATSYNIAAASILAKVHRDRLMQKYDEIYPQYGFAKHKGYGTKFHIEQIKKYGLCEIHRRSFVKNFYAEQT